MWGGSVTAWSTTPNHVDPQQATLVSYQLTVQSGSATDQLWGAAAPRN